MADVAFNIAKGKAAYYGDLPNATFPNAALIVVPLQTAGLAADSVLVDQVNLTGVLANATEQTTMGRKTAANVAATVDHANDRVDIDFNDVVWTAATGAAVSALVVCYVPDNTAQSNATTIPISKHDFVVTPNGGDITAQIATGGFFRAS